MTKRRSDNPLAERLLHAVPDKKIRLKWLLRADMGANVSIISNFLLNVDWNEVTWYRTDLKKFPVASAEKLTQSFVESLSDSNNLYKVDWFVSNLGAKHILSCSLALQYMFFCKCIDGNQRLHYLKSVYIIV